MPGVQGLTTPTGRSSRKLSSQTCCRGRIHTSVELRAQPDGAPKLDCGRGHEEVALGRRPQRRQLLQHQAPVVERLQARQGRVCPPDSTRDALQAAPARRLRKQTCSAVWGGLRADGANAPQMSTILTCGLLGFHRSDSPYLAALASRYCCAASWSSFLHAGSHTLPTAVDITYCQRQEGWWLIHTGCKCLLLLRKADACSARTGSRSPDMPGEVAECHAVVVQRSVAAAAQRAGRLISLTGLQHAASMSNGALQATCSIAHKLDCKQYPAISNFSNLATMAPA